MQGQAKPLPVSKTGGQGFKSLRPCQSHAADAQAEETSDPVQRAPAGASAGRTSSPSVPHAV